MTPYEQVAKELLYKVFPEATMISKSWEDEKLAIIAAALLDTDRKVREELGGALEKAEAERADIAICTTCTKKFYAPRSVIHVSCPHCLIPKLQARGDAYMIENKELAEKVRHYEQFVGERVYAEKCDELESQIAAHLQEKEALQKEIESHKENTLDGDCQVCDYETFQKKITSLQKAWECAEEVLDFIASRKHLTFAECLDAEEIVGKAQAALKKIRGAHE